MTIFQRLTPRACLLIGLAIIAATAATLLAFGQPAICTCGFVRVWQADVMSAENSQQLSDWYSPSHFIHGLLFYWLMWLLFRRQSLQLRAIGALILECSWEILENTPMVIDRYREATAALGYEGDSILNSLADVAMMAVGFLLARKLPVWASIAIVLALELIPLFTIRDNLTLNVWMLLLPTDWLKEWQSAA